MLAQVLMASTATVLTPSSRLANLQLKSVKLPEAQSYDYLKRPWPLTLKPATHSQPLASWAAEHRDELLALVAEHDAVLLRGFAQAESSMDFSKFVMALDLEDFEMGCSAAPRTNVAPGVFTANEAPPTEPIPFHHEMAQCDDKPAYVVFFCEKPAVQDGATPIIPSHAVARHLRKTHPVVAAKFAQLGVRYARTLPLEHDPSSPIGKSWRAAFNATTREEAEAAMTAAGTSWTWLPSGDVRTVTKRLPALVMHAKTGQEMFFNAAVAASVGWVDSRNDPTKAVLYGDGSELDGEALEALASVRGFMEAERVAFTWQAGDVLLLDNYKAMHSRQPFVGPRRVLASLWGPSQAPIEDGAFAQHEPSFVARARSALPLRIPAPARRFADRFLRLRGGAMASAVLDETRLTLGTGAKMPAVGLGLWKVPKAACAAAVTAAIRLGYRHLDCACDYGNEAEVGDGIRAAISEGLVTREELWVTSKLWNTYHASEHIEPACRRTLDDLGLDYVDLYLVHFPISLKFVPFETRYPPEWVHDPDAPEPRMELEKVPFCETWKGMEALQRRGLAKNIGVCNMNTAGLRDLLSYADIPPAVLQVELHPYLQQPKLIRFAEENGIQVTGFSPLGAGSYVELDMAATSDSALRDPIVAQIAETKGVSPAQLILKWALQRGISVIPKSSKADRLEENLKLEGFELSDAEMAQMATLDRARRFNDPGVFCLGMGVFCPIYD